MKTFEEIEKLMDAGAQAYVEAQGDYDKVPESARVTNEEIAYLYQHYLDTNTLPLTAEHTMFAGMLLKSGVLVAPGDKREREPWEAAQGQAYASDDDATKRTYH